MATINMPTTTPKKHIAGACYGLSGYGVFQETQAPLPISDFTATDDETEQVTCTWTEGGDTETVDIYKDGVILDSYISSPYIDTFVGTAEYYVVSNNLGGSTESNRDSGTGVDVVAPR